jgi:hypothetical protein
MNWQHSKIKQSIPKCANTDNIHLPHDLLPGIKKQCLKRLGSVTLGDQGLKEYELLPHSFRHGDRCSMEIESASDQMETQKRFTLEKAFH